MNTGTAVIHDLSRDSILREVEASLDRLRLEAIDLYLVERLAAGAIAVAWALHRPAVHGAIVGFRKPDQIEPLALAGAVELSADDLAAIES